MTRAPAPITTTAIAQKPYIAHTVSYTLNMATETQTQPNGSLPHFTIVDRLDGVPIVHDSAAYAQALLESYPLVNNLYQTALVLANKSVDVASPVLTRAKPVLESADGLSVAIFDRAESTFPYPFKTPTQDLVGVKQAKAVYDERLLPVLKQASPVIQEVYEKLVAINSAIGARLGFTAHKGQEVSQAILHQLLTIAQQAPHLPGQLLHGLTNITNDLKQIAFDKSIPVNEKSKAIGAYVVDQAKPVVDEIYAYYLGAKEKVEEGVEQVQQTVGQEVQKGVGQAQKGASQVQNKAQKGASQVQNQAQGAADSARQTVDQHTS
ncbi:hypothetical protein Q5752_002839 [Cryptotrichosporon argae]